MSLKFVLQQKICTSVCNKLQNNLLFFRQFHCILAF